MLLNIFLSITAWKFIRHARQDWVYMVWADLIKLVGKIGLWFLFKNHFFYVKW